MIMAKHGYQPTEEETKNVLKMRGGQSCHALILLRQLSIYLSPLNVASALQPCGALRQVLACAVTNVSELGAGVVGGILMWNATSPRFTGTLLPFSRSAALPDARAVLHHRASSAKRCSTCSLHAIEEHHA